MTGKERDDTVKVHVSLYAFGEVSSRMIARMWEEQKKEVNMKNNKTDYKLFHVCEYMKTRNCNDEEEKKLRYIAKRIEEHMSWGDINLFVVADDMIIEFQDILQRVEYRNRRPVYMMQISRENNGQRFELKRTNNIKIKTRDFCQGMTNTYSFIIKGSIEMNYLVNKLVEELYMSFQDFMLKDISNRFDPFEAPFVHIPDFLIKRR